jgi:hypothetical protein
VFRRSRNDCLMSKMNPVENAYGEKEWARQLGELWDRAEGLHHKNDE